MSKWYRVEVLLVFGIIIIFAIILLPPILRYNNLQTSAQQAVKHTKAEAESKPVIDILSGDNADVYLARYVDNEHSVVCFISYHSISCVKF